MDELGEDHRLSGKIHPEGQGVRSADHVENPFPEGRFHQELLLGEHPTVVDPHSVEEGLLNLGNLEDCRQF